MELMADKSLARFFSVPKVGIAISIRIRMMAMTISSSINVKPLGGVEPLGCLWRGTRRSGKRKALRFMGFPVPRERTAREDTVPFSEKMLQRTDAPGKAFARKDSSQCTVRSQKPA